MSLPTVLPRTPVRTCKVCFSLAPWLGAVDFSKWCSRDWRLAPTTGISVDYYRCNICGLLFSPSFDEFSPDDWKTYVYNPQYLSIDPDYTGERGVVFAKMMANIFPDAANLHVIDYGCGKGFFADKLRKLNWQNVTNYDPFVPEFSTRPTSRADLVFACEVLEHAHDPVATFEEMASLRADIGVIVATSLLIPLHDIPSLLDWWYVAPRNGHITIHSSKSLAMLAAKAYLRTASSPDGNIHFFWQQTPDWASKVLAR